MLVSAFNLFYLILFYLILRVWVALQVALIDSTQTNIHRGSGPRGGCQHVLSVTLSKITDFSVIFADRFTDECSGAGMNLTHLT